MLRTLKISHLVPRLRSLSSHQKEVIFDVQGKCGTILLNRPTALNSYNNSMVKAISAQLMDWEKDDRVELVLLEGSGDRAFCAGGDIVVLGDIYEENQLHHKVKTCSKPIVALGDGFVLGGGMGLCVNSKYRVATERSTFAMPETRIGYFPDTGGSYFLPRLPGSLGMFLALTGHSIKGYDSKILGFATHFIKSEDMNKLKNSILECSKGADLETVLSSASSDSEEDFSLKENVEEINACFSAPSVLEIVSRLKASNSQFSSKTLDTLSLMSPIALSITHKMQTLGRDLDYTACMSMEYDVSTPTMALGEFKEGVRALLIDKDNKPRWNPTSLELVDKTIVDRCFLPGVRRWEPLP